MFLKVLGGYGNAFGLDVSPQALAYCRGKTSAKLVEASGDRIPFRDGSFLLISLLDIVEHSHDDLAVMGEVYRVCKPGGIVLITVPAFSFLWGSHDVSHHHKRRYTLEKLKDLGLSAGFVVERATYTNFFIFLPVLLKRVISRFFQNSGGSDLKETQGWVSGLMKRIYSIEARYLIKSNFPWGVSLLMVLRKRDSEI
jgi:SAM-dependent methyltransferase